MKKVIIESPFAGDVQRNVRYARLCMLDSLRRGEAPFLSHLLYTQVLDDTCASDRRLGIEAGFAWRSCADLTVFYTDLGWSAGMHLGRDDAERTGLPFEERSLGVVFDTPETPECRAEGPIKLAVWKGWAGELLSRAPQERSQQEVDADEWVISANPFYALHQSGTSVEIRDGEVEIRTIPGSAAPTINVIARLVDAWRKSSS